MPCRRSRRSVRAIAVPRTIAETMSRTAAVRAAPKMLAPRWLIRKLSVVM
jgi:hypothetical protein